MPWPSCDGSVITSYSIHYTKLYDVQTRHVEVAKFYTEDQHTAVPDYLVIATKVWDGLSDEQRAILTTAAQHSETYEQQLWDKEVAASRQKRNNFV